MKRRIIVWAAVLCSLALLCGCDANFLTPKKDPAEVYSKLSSLANNPEGNTDLDGIVTFAAYIASDPSEEAFEEEEKIYTYQVVYISRNLGTPIYLDVTDIQDRLPNGTYAKITGTVTGSVYWTEENQQEKVLDFHASKMEPFEVSEEDPSTENRLEVKESGQSGVFEFVGAHHSQTSFHNVVVVYFNFTNTAGESNTKMNEVGTLLRRLEISLGEEYAENTSSVFKPKELDPKALDAHAFQAYTPPGKTQLYYITIEVDEASVDTDCIWVDAYDDEFAWTNSVELPVAASLEEMEK